MTDGQSTRAGHLRRTGQLLTIALLMAVGLFVLAGCSAAGTTPVASPVVPRGTEQPAASPVLVTSANNGTTLRLTVGQRFVLDLGSSVDWAVTVSDEQVVGRVMDAPAPAGAQGVYEARSTGSTVLDAIGSPPCPSGSVCPMFRIGFRLTIVVG